MRTHLHEFATRPILIRQALAVHGRWIEDQLGVPLSEMVIFEGLKNLSQVGVDKVFGISDLRRIGKRQSRRLRTLVENAEVPPKYPPMLSLTHDVTVDLALEALVQDREASWTGFEWGDCPLALRLYVYDCTVITMNVAYHSGPVSPDETTGRLLIARRDCVSKVVRLIEDLYRRDRTPHLHTVNGRLRRVPSVEWDDLIIDANVTNLLKNDFETFWERAEWFQDRNLPFRRGYLLHGPPGNGKTSAIRAMMTSRKLNAHTLRFFDPRTEDSDLDEVFDSAQRDRPSLVLLEDIDRAFPKGGESKSKISLPQLLNCLDGVATGEGIVVVATANDPAVLDPAILRRPGRFDRVVHFANPDEELRLEYFRRMNSGLGDDQLRQPVDASNGFSFAQLREAYVMAGQFAFERSGEVTENDLLTSIRSLREGMMSSARREGSAGFGTSY